MSTASNADVINDAAADPVPSMPAPLSGEITLLRGLAFKEDDESLTWHDHATTRELTGADEEKLATLENKPGLTYTEYMNTILENAVLKIGDLNVSQMPGIANKLILADRDMLFLAVLRSTYGSTRTIRARCSECGATNDVVIDLAEDFPITHPDFDIREPIEVETSKGTVKLRMITGEDTVEAQKIAKTDAELNTVMLSRCAVWGDLAPVDKLEWARSLSVADRKKLTETLQAIDIGPNLQGVDTHCAECEANMPILLDWVSLLLS